MIARIILLGCLLSASPLLFASEASDPYECNKRKPCLKHGAEVFHYRCSLCHGNDGLGEGILPLALGNYPNTNLLEPRFGKSLRRIEDVIRKGGKMKKVNDEMPPWEDELNRREIKSVALFNEFLHRDFEAAVAMLKDLAKGIEPSKRIGRAIYLGRCALCHGKSGRGNGKMVRIIKNPPPFNLTLSRVDDHYLYNIIYKGGEAMNRSPKMPPWGKDLNEQEIESLILYLKTLRK